MASIDLILFDISSSQNDKRAAAELLLNQHLANDANNTILGLGNCLLHTDVTIRSLAPILLRRLCLTCSNSDIPLINNLFPATISSIQSMLLQSLISENQTSVRRKVSHTVSDFASYLQSNPQASLASWSELVPTLLQFLQSQIPGLRESCYSILASVPELLYTITNIPIDVLLLQILQDSDIQCRVMAVKLVCAFLVNAETDIQTKYTPIIDLLVQSLQFILNSTDPITKADGQSEFVDAVSYMIELAEELPKVYRSVLPSLIVFISQIMVNTNLEDSTRQTPLELIMTLVETAPGMMKKQSSLAATIIPILLDWMHEIEDDPEWYNSESINDDDEGTNDSVAEQSLDRFAIKLTGTLVLPVAFSIIPTLLSSGEWTKRHAALRAISCIGEGCHEIINSELEKVVGLIVPHFQDPHPRVRHAATNAIGQMCSDFCPEIQNNFHNVIVNNLVFIMGDEKYPRLQAYAATAMVNFSEDTKIENIAPYLNIIFEKLILILNTGKTYAQEQAVCSIGSVAESAGVQFVRYYSIIMPILMNILDKANSKEHRMLRGKTVECATLIASSVGKDVFGADAEMFLQMMMKIQQSIVDPDDPQASYMLSGWARLSETLGNDFAPYLDVVLPPLFEFAKSEPEYCVFNQDEDVDTDKYNADDGWEFLDYGDKSVCIKTTLLDSKCTAIELLVAYVQAMGSNFLPYVETVLKITVPLFRFYYHDGVKFASVMVIPYLFKCLLDANVPRAVILTSWFGVCEKMLNAMIDDTDSSYTVHVLECFQKTIGFLGENGLSPDLMQKITTFINTQLKSFLVRINEREYKKELLQEDEEDQDILDEEEYDEILFSELSRTLQKLLESQKCNYLDYFEQLLPQLEIFMKTNHWLCRQWSIFAYSYLVEHTGIGSAKYQSHILPFIISGLSDVSSYCRHASAYAIGVCAQYGGETYTGTCVETLVLLFRISQTTQELEESDLSKENAISAIGKICRYLGKTNTFDVEMILGEWVKLLPVVKDYDECGKTYEYFLELIKGQNRAILGYGNQNLCGIIVKALVSDVLEEREELLKEMVGALMSLGNIENVENVSKLQNLGLNSEEIEKLKFYFKI